MEAQLLDSDSDDEGLTVKAKKAGCEAVYIKSEDGSEGPGYWHFSQKYGEGNHNILVWELTCRYTMETHQVAMGCLEITEDRRKYDAQQL